MREKPQPNGEDSKVGARQVVRVAGKEGKTPIRRQSTSAKLTEFFPFDEVGMNAEQNA